MPRKIPLLNSNVSNIPKVRLASFGYWASIPNQRYFFDQLGRHLGLDSLEEYYALTSSVINKNGGRGLLARYGNCPALALRYAYPEHSWIQWNFPQVSKGFWNVKSNERSFFDWLGTQLGITSMEDWYQVSLDDYARYHGQGLLEKYNWSPSKALSSIYSDHIWLEWKFNQTPKGSWDSLIFQRKYLDWLGITLGFKRMEHYYSLKYQHFLDHHGATLLTMYHTSPYLILKTVYHEHNWIPWKMHVPQGYWDSLGNRRIFVHWLNTNMKVKNLADWYRISISQIQLLASSRPFEKFGFQILTEAYPNHPWDIAKLTAKREETKNQGISLVEQRAYFDSLGKKLGVESFEDWNQFNVEDIHRQGAKDLLEKFYGNSLCRALQTLYPEHSWHPWQIEPLDEDFWEKTRNQKKFMDWLGKTLGFKSNEDWYSITSKTVIVNGGQILLKKFDSSLSKILRSIYEDHVWYEWKFIEVEKGFWEKISNQKKFMEWLRRHLDLQSLDDWYKLDHHLIHKNGGEQFLDKYADSVEALKTVYPDHTWRRWRFQSVSKGYRIPKELTEINLELFRH